MGVVSKNQDVFAEIEETFGQVPTWLSRAPEPALPGFWRLMHDYYLAETQIPNKYKELIGIAVSGATRCRYCQLFHTEAAKLFGATDEEIAEAAMMGGVTMMSSTFINALGTDYEEFVRETRAIVAHVKAQQAKAAKPSPKPGDQPSARV
jgi:AhpD family alkylhydroperoxidase